MKKDELEDDALAFEITDNERRHLRTMLKSPGHIVQRKIMRSYIDAITEGALAASKIDPLANADKIAHRWAYVTIAEELLQQLENGVKFEIDLLEANEKPKASLEQLSKRRRVHASFGAFDGLPED